MHHIVEQASTGWGPTTTGIRPLRVRTTASVGVVSLLLAGLGVLAAPSAEASVPSASEAAAGASTWVQLSPARHPSARSFAAMAYDPATDQLVLFGGQNTGFRQLGDTWTWDGTSWTHQQPVTSPHARAGASMAYDAQTGQLVLFGGGFAKRGTLRNFRSTWTWDGTNWTKQQPISSPKARSGASMAYDAATGQLVLFGGLLGNTVVLGDTWTWDGLTWIRQHPVTSPRNREYASMAYDTASSQLVLFGGDFLSSRGFGDDTWTWDGASWTQQQPTSSPTARRAAAMADDPAIGKIVLFGGEDVTATLLDDTWSWNGTTWRQRHPVTSPPARSGAAMAYDAASGQLVLFGGLLNTDGSADNGTWIYTSVGSESQRLPLG